MLTIEQINDISLMMDKFIKLHRPHPDIRHNLDIGWRMKDQSVYLFEVRPQWDNEAILHKYDYAKATWVQSRKHWEIFWMGANGKWHRYKELESVGNLQRFLIETERDPYYCFQG
jgi:hypothetical protein